MIELIVVGVACASIICGDIGVGGNVEPFYARLENEYAKARSTLAFARENFGYVDYFEEQELARAERREESCRRRLDFFKGLENHVRRMLG